MSASKDEICIGELAQGKRDKKEGVGGNEKVFRKKLGRAGSRKGKTVPIGPEKIEKK